MKKKPIAKNPESLKGSKDDCVNLAPDQLEDLLDEAALLEEQEVEASQARMDKSTDLLY